MKDNYEYNNLLMDAHHENVSGDISNIKHGQWRAKGTECCIVLKLYVSTA